MSVYRVIDVIGTSTQSWEDAAVTAHGGRLDLEAKGGSQ